MNQCRHSVVENAGWMVRAVSHVIRGVAMKRKRETQMNGWKRLFSESREQRMRFLDVGFKVSWQWSEDSSYHFTGMVRCQVARLQHAGLPEKGSFCSQRCQVRRMREKWKR